LAGFCFTLTVGRRVFCWIGVDLGPDGFDLGPLDFDFEPGLKPGLEPGLVTFDELLVLGAGFFDGLMEPILKWFICRTRVFLRELVLRF
jgi:hypothetical protein